MRGRLDRKEQGKHTKVETNNGKKKDRLGAPSPTANTVDGGGVDGKWGCLGGGGLFMRFGDDDRAAPGAAGTMACYPRGAA
ncbi:hypothetical protein CCACVL1_28249 [Corchorus capsularis]|uniref:Uncharacterized protein n=1 Tax=Corchorus capsularis TaxID=210143 RepID=A0A1R3G745_COCAP|nr:hypothetical protein CCACVL1_28249 [Corchorus capsularis]